MQNYSAPKFSGSAFNCPICGAYAKQKWTTAGKSIKRSNGWIQQGVIVQIAFAECDHCNQHSIWKDDKMIFPNSGAAPLPNSDLPEDIKNDYEEARNIVNLSPRGSAALLRLVLQKLCKALGEKGKNINDDIGNLVKKGLPEKMQKALDSVRVVGNNAVHPGQIDLTDDIETAHKLFGFINIIADVMITQPKQIDEFYDLKIPDNIKNKINERDGK